MKPGWRIVDALSRLLKREDREAVLGDSMEAGEGWWQAALAVFGLAIRREIALWKNWRPWLAAFGIALPCSFLLMGFSLSVSRAYLQFVKPGIGPGFLLFACNAALLGGWAWSGGFVIGSLSRRTLWVSAALSFLPCLFCLSRFHIESLSRFCLLLFLAPAIWGVSRGLRVTQIGLFAAIFLAMAVTLLTIPAWGSSGPWIPNWALSWPAWYLVATARKPVRRLKA